MQTTPHKTTQLGQTGLEITRGGFGAWAIGGGGWKLGWGSQEDDQSLTAINRALDEAINWIDTAAYGFGHSERVVGRRLRDSPNDRSWTSIRSEQRHEHSRAAPEPRCSSALPPRSAPE